MRRININKKNIIASILIFASILSIKNIVSLDNTKIYVNPSNGSYNVGSTFSVNVDVANANKLSAWDFKLYYDTKLLDVVNTATEGTFLSKVGTTFYGVKEIKDNYNATHGRIWAYAVSMNQDGASGSGTLAKINFKVIDQGTGNIILSETKLSDNSVNKISHTTGNGKYDFKQSCTCTAWKASYICCSTGKGKWTRTCTPKACQVESKCEGACFV